MSCFCILQELRIRIFSYNLHSIYIWFHPLPWIYSESIWSVGFWRPGELQLKVPQTSLQLSDRGRCHPIAMPKPLFPFRKMDSRIRIQNPCSSYLIAPSSAGHWRWCLFLTPDFLEQIPALSKPQRFAESSHSREYSLVRCQVPFERADVSGCLWVFFYIILLLGRKQCFLFALALCTC